MIWAWILSCFDIASPSSPVVVVGGSTTISRRWEVKWGMHSSLTGALDMDVDLTVIKEGEEEEED